MSMTKSSESKLYGEAYGIFDKSKKITKKTEKAVEKLKIKFKEAERNLFLNNDLVINNF